jgi:hypothetical protein
MTFQFFPRSIYLSVRLLSTPSSCPPPLLSVPLPLPSDFPAPPFRRHSAAPRVCDRIRPLASAPLRRPPATDPIL